MENRIETDYLSVSKHEEIMNNQLRNQELKLEEKFRQKVEKITDKQKDVIISQLKEDFEDREKKFAKQMQQEREDLEEQHQKEVKKLTRQLNDRLEERENDYHSKDKIIKQLTRQIEDKEIQFLELEEEYNQRREIEDMKQNELQD